MRFLAVLTSLVPLLLLAQDPKDKEGRSLETIRYREFPEILEEIARDAESSEKSLVVWLIDNAPMLKSSKHGELLSENILRCFKKPGVSHAVVSLSETAKVLLKPTEDPSRAASAISQLAAAPPDNAVKNCLQNVRDAAKLAASFSCPKKYIVLFTQDNADNEDDVEATAKVLKASGASFIPIVPEAIASDSYWEAALAGVSYVPGGVDKFRKLSFKLKGPEGAFIEFPYGFPFSFMNPAETVPSGFAPWGIARLAAHSGGKVFLYSVDRSLMNFCRRYSCLVCGGEHKSCGAEYIVTKLKIVEPPLLSRSDYMSRYGKNRLVAATFGTWDHLYREGILQGMPALKPGGAGLVENVRSDKDPRPVGLQLTVDWKTVHQEALKNADTVEKATVELLETEKRYEKEKELDFRAIGTADAFLVYLKLLSQSYRQLALFCEEVDKASRAKRPADPVAAPEFSSPEGDKVIGWYWRNYPLCHGGAPLKEIKFLGDPKALHSSLDFADRMIEKEAGTPWELLIRRASLPAFIPLFEQKRGTGGAVGQPPRPTAKSTSTQATTETPGSPQRPSRGGPVDSGQGGGTATGGNR
jgi:hypothetical protein